MRLSKLSRRRSFTGLQAKSRKSSNLKKKKKKKENRRKGGSTNLEVVFAALLRK
jgi:hypothetical protein